VELKGKQKIQVFNDAEEREVFDIVISTIPVPQLLNLRNIDKILEGQLDLP
jgi:hypothetical protein